MTGTAHTVAAAFTYDRELGDVPRASLVQAVMGVPTWLAPTERSEWIDHRKRDG